MIVLMVVVLFLLISFSHMVNMVLLLRGVGPTLDNGYGI